VGVRVDAQKRIRDTSNRGRAQSVPLDFRASGSLQQQVSRSSELYGTELGHPISSHALGSPVPLNRNDQVTKAAVVLVVDTFFASACCPPKSLSVFCSDRLLRADPEDRAVVL
jgi:hypothetical protein